ncbi:transferase family-domain-containing protein [Tricladium varicosporioides]|nr:transferase family-domain-containing protein [Hymenoscyphus varicosporioides]
MSIATQETTRLFPSPRNSKIASTPLSILDTTVARFSATGAIWLFDRACVQNKGPCIEDLLKSSFIEALNYFPQWAGQLQWAPFREGAGHSERFNRALLVYGSPDDPGVEWIVANHSQTIESLVPQPKERVSNNGIWMATDFPQKIFLSETPLALHNLKEYIGLPGMTAQINKFSCGGYAIGIKMAHPLADAQALMVFMHQWAAASRALNGHPEKAQSLMGAPVFDPAVLDSCSAGDIDAPLADSKLISEARSLPLHRFDWWATEAPGYPSFLIPTTETSKPPPEVFTANALSPAVPAPWNTWNLMLPVEQAQIHFSELELLELRDAARSSRPDISRLDALLAHVWALINRAKGHAQSEEDVFLNITLGARSRVEPKLPDSFIGSPLFLAYIRASGTSAASPSLSETAASIRETISLFTPQKVAAMLHDAAHEVAPQRVWQAFLGNNHTLVTSWMRLGVYDVDFEGNGLRPRYVQAVMPKMDGCVQVMESEGSGIDISLYLERGAMGRLVDDKELRAYHRS